MIDLWWIYDGIFHGKLDDKSGFFLFVDFWNMVVFHSKLLGLPEGTPYLAQMKSYGAPRDSYISWDMAVAEFYGFWSIRQLITGGGHPVGSSHI